MNILMLNTDWATNEERRKNNLYGGVGYYRIYKPAEQLRKAGHDVKVYGADFQTLGKTDEEVWTKAFENDLIITKPIDEPRAASALMACRDYFGKKVLVDLDDNYFEVKPDQPGYKYYHPGSQKRSMFASFLSLADGLICSTEPLKEYYKKFLKDTYGIDMPIFTLPNFNDINDFKFRKARKKKNIVIGYAGSVTHNKDLALVLPIIRKLMKKYPTLEFEVLGAVAKNQALDIFKNFEDELLDRVFMKGGTQTWKGYPELLAKQSWDIAIAPLVDDDFNRGKSHIKWMEYAMYKIPCVASKVYPYYKDIDGIKTIQNGKTGFLARSRKDWEIMLTNLIENKYLREEIGNNAYKYVKENWQHNNKINEICNTMIQQT